MSLPGLRTELTLRTIVTGCDQRSPLINRYFGHSCDRAKLTANVQTNRISGTTKC